MNALQPICVAKGGKRGMVLLATVCVMMLAFESAPLAAGPHMLQPRVPSEQLDEARALTSPLPDSPDSIEKGKALFMAKGRASTATDKRERVMPRGLPVESITSQLSASRILAASHRRRNLLGYQAWLARHQHGWICGPTDGRRDLVHHSV